jgi:hypothetical protein
MFSAYALVTSLLALAQRETMELEHEQAAPNHGESTFRVLEAPVVRLALVVYLVACLIVHYPPANWPNS